MTKKYEIVEELIDSISNLKDILSSLLRDLDSKNINYNDLSDILEKEKEIQNYKEELTKYNWITLSEMNLSFHILSENKFNRLISIFNTLKRLVEGRKVNISDFNQETLNDITNRFKFFIRKMISELNAKIDLLNNVMIDFDYMEVGWYLSEAQGLLKNGTTKYKGLLTDQIIKAKSVKNLRYLRIFEDESGMFYVFPKSAPLIKKINWTYHLTDKDVHNLQEIINTVLNRFNEFEQNLSQSLLDIEQEDIDDQRPEVVIFEEQKDKKIPNNFTPESEATSVYEEVSLYKESNEDHSDLQELLNYLKNQTQMLDQLEVNSLSSPLIISNSILVVFTSFNTLMELIKNNNQDLYNQLIENRENEVNQYKYPLITNTLGIKNVIELNNFIILLNKLETIVFNINLINTALRKTIFNILNLLINSSVTISNKILLKNLN